MKAGIHPDVQLCTVTCTCGNTFQIMSDKETMNVDLCSACHPFYTGQQKFVDAAGRVDRFNQRFSSNLELSKLASKDSRKKDVSKLAFKFNPKEPKVVGGPRGKDDDGKGGKPGKK
jgi:large subunit ribosomal protein L31